MYNEPQVSSRGEWGDVTVVADSQGRFDYYCRYCGEKFKSRKLERVIEHQQICKKDLVENKIEGVDYIKCRLCNYHGKSLKTHLTTIHKDVDAAEYEKQYGKLICEKSSKRYIDGNKSHDSWIKVRIDNGEDLSEYWKKVSKGVSKAIMGNSTERQRRSKMMAALNDKQQSDPEFQKIVSETAKKTSSRADILQKRSEQLANWRDKNPEEFYEKCVKKMITAFQSKPERKLFEFISTIDGFSFKRNQFVKSIDFSSKSKRRQIDMIDKKHRIYVEFDGRVHFDPIFGDDVLQENIKRDQEKEKHISNHNWTLIRVSYDQYVDKNKIEKSYFKQDCLSRIIEILQRKEPGIYKIGEAYGER